MSFHEINNKKKEIDELNNSTKCGKSFHRNVATFEESSWWRSRSYAELRMVYPISRLITEQQKENKHASDGETFMFWVNVW